MRHHSSANHCQTPDLRGPSRCRRANLARCATVLLFIGSLSGALWAQNAPAAPERGGPQIRSVSGYFDYYSVSLPNGGSQPSANSISGEAGGGSVQIGWSKSRERYTSSFTYTTSLTGRVRSSQGNAWNHAFSFTASRKLAPRWMFDFSAAGDFSSQEQSLFSPTALSNIASVPATFDDLAAAMRTSNFSNPQLASALTSAPLAESPVRNLFYGQRMFTSAVRTALSYSYSPRLTVSFQAFGGRSQHIQESQAEADRNSYLIPNTTSGSAGLAVSYSLSSRTQLGATVTANRISSSLQDAYTTTSLATLGWNLGRRWLLEVHGGAGVTHPVRQTYLVSTSPKPAGGGSLAFKTSTQTFLGSFDHTVSDSYGSGAAATSSAGGTWRWSRPGRNWWLESNLGWQQLQGNGLGGISGWRTTAGIGRTIGAHISWFTQYAYLDYSSQLQKSHGRQSAVRVSVVWSPYPETSR